MAIKVLIVEDQLPELYEAALRAENGMEFVTARRGDHAIQAFIDMQFDAIIMDLRLPVIGGLEVIRWIRTRDPDVPIIAVTAYPDKHTRQEAKQVGANAFFTMPPDYRRLRLEILRLVTMRRARQEAATKRRRLQHLREQAAYMGAETPAHVRMEIEDLEREPSDD